MPLDARACGKTQAEELANGGYRILAVTSGTIDLLPEDISEEHLQGLTFLGLIGMIDPPLLRVQVGCGFLQKGRRPGGHGHRRPSEYSPDHSQSAWYG